MESGSVGAADVEGGIMAQLTQRQRDLLRLLSNGDSQKEAAAKLGLAHSTVRKMTMDMRQRTDCRNMTELAVKAAEQRK